MHVNESSENYLETILMLSKKLPVVRAVDIATELNFKKSSVSVAMKKLRESEHIIVSREGYITLTESGQAIADMIYERHTLLSSWLERLGVDPQVAADDACRMEHVIVRKVSTRSRSILFLILKTKKHLQKSDISSVSAFFLLLLIVIMIPTC